MSALERFGAAVDPLHFGDFGGLVSKLVWFIVGLGLTGLAITGLVIYWCRMARAVKELRRPRILRAFHPWRGAMGWFKPLNWAVLGATVVAGVMTTDFYLRGPGTLPARYAPLEIGPWRLGATLVAGLGDTSDPVKPGARVMALINYCPGCWDGIRQLAIHVSTAPPLPDHPGIRVYGQPGYAYARVALPTELGPQQRLWLIAEGWDHQRHVASWAIVRPQAGAQP